MTTSKPRSHRRRTARGRVFDRGGKSLLFAARSSRSTCRSCASRAACDLAGCGLSSGL